MRPLNRVRVMVADSARAKRAWQRGEGPPAPRLRPAPRCSRGDHSCCDGVTFLGHPEDYEREHALTSGDVL